MPSARCCALAAGLTSMFCAQARAQAYIIDVGVLPPNRNVTALNAISDNGQVAAGVSAQEIPRYGWALQQAVRWTPNGMVGLGPNSTTAAAMTPDGGVVVGEGTDPADLYRFAAFRWDPANGYQALQAPADWIQLSANGVSADGAVVVGGAMLNGSQLPCRWTSQGVEQLPGVGSAFATSGDGQVIVGWANGCAARWVGGQGPECFANGQPSAITRDGRICVGYVVIGYDGGLSITRATRWIFSAGSISSIDLGVLPGSSPASARSSGAGGVSADGRTIVGSSQTTPMPNGGFYTSAFVWREDLGMMDLRAYLVSLGVDMTNRYLSGAGPITPDGTIIAAGQYIIHLPPWCGSADFNHDGDSGTDADIEAFFACLGGQCCPACDSADFNADGDVGTDADIEAFFRVLAGNPCR